MVRIVPMKNEEVDRQFGGGLPLPSLILIEGDHGAGKSVVTAQFMKGILADGMKILFVTENNIREYIDKMKTITYDFSLAFLQNKISMLPLHVYGAKWSTELAKHLLPILSRYISMNTEKYNVVVIDSLSLLTMYSDNDTILDFITRCKYMVSNGTTIIITLHPSIISQDIAPRLKSVCDCYIRVKSANVAGRDVKVMEIVKLVGAKGQITAQFSFEIDNAFGMKIVPIAMANA